MKTIRKQTADLKFGDVVFSSSRPDVVFVRFLPSPPLPMAPGMLVATTTCDRFVELLEQDGSTKSAYFPASVEVVSYLTPAQQHADELLTFVRNVAGDRVTFKTGSVEYLARMLLDKIDPPQPPGLDEALAMLRDIREVINPPGLGVTTGQMLDKLLDRARRSGVLK